MAIEIVDLPSYKMVIFHSYVSLPEGNPIMECMVSHGNNHLFHKDHNCAAMNCSHLPGYLCWILMGYIEVSWDTNGISMEV